MFTPNVPRYQRYSRASISIEIRLSTASIILEEAKISSFACSIADLARYKCSISICKDVYLYLILIQPCQTPFPVLFSSKALYLNPSMASDVQLSEERVISSHVMRDGYYSLS